MVVVSLSTIILLVLISKISSQLVSPCPRLFQYETGNAETDRWYGTLTLIAESDLNGVWLRVVFDRPSIQLGNWFGEVKRIDDKEYLVKNPKQKLTTNSPLKVRFFVKYVPGEPAPRLVEFRLNARTVCPENGPTTVAPPNEGVLSTSAELSTTSQPFELNNNQNSNNNNNRPTQGSTTNFQVENSNNKADEEYFQGDFSFLNRPRPIPSLEVACGTVVRPPRPLITHGQATHEGEFPWHAALYHATGIQLTYICGASLITKYHLITVAHCVTRPKTNQPLPVDSLVVYLGKYYLRRWYPGIQDKHVGRILVHPSYSAQAFTNDIALLRLDSAVDVTDYVRPICLWAEDERLEGIVGRVGTVVGWGFDENGKITDRLTKAQMPVVAQSTCIYSFPDFYSRFTSSKSFCAGFLNGTSVCNGDSGGGIAFARKGTEGGDSPVWMLRGMVSISVALQNQLKCDSSHYVVFTDVAKFLDWIRTSLV